MPSLPVASSQLGPSSPKTQHNQNITPSTPSNKTTPGHKESPVTRNNNSAKATEPENLAKERYYRLADEIEKHTLGPMPVRMFMQKYLPEPDTDEVMPTSTGAFDGLPTEGRENLINEPLAQALNGPRSRRCPGIKFFNTGDRNEDQYGPKIDICGYMEGFGGTVTMPGSLDTFVEIKLEDFACDKPGKGKEFLYGHINNQDDAQHAKHGLGQQVSYAVDTFARQHRIFLFSIFVTRTHARLLRWDRAGVIISTAFEYRAKPEILCQFLWRFGHMTDAQRGCDLTVTTANKKEEEMFKNAIEAHVKTQLGVNHANLEREYDRHYQPGKVIKIPVRKRMQVTTEECDKVEESHEETTLEKGTFVQGGTYKADLSHDKTTQGVDAGNSCQGKLTQEKVTFDESQEIVEFLVSRPVVSPASLASRATRGYWAVHVKNKTVHFLKDAWRTDVERMEIEGRILEKLAIGGVQKNIPELLCWSDVGPKEMMAYCTDTDKYSKDGDPIWNMHRIDKQKRFTNRVHYRQVVNEAGYTLEHLSGTRELLKGARDVFHALCDARLKCTLLHRDVSSSNIILFADGENQYPQRRAILVDWELSCEDKESPARDHWISGTWPFMSIAMLKNLRPHHICDDIESLIYVVFYCAIHYLPWEKYDYGDHEYIIKNFFNEIPRRERGAIGKRSNSVDNDFFSIPQFKHVTQWLYAARPIIDAWSREVFPSAPQPKVPSSPPIMPPPSHERAIEVYHPLFEKDPAYWLSLLEKNRHYNNHIYTGPNKDVYPATESSANRRLRLEAPASIHTSESASKRPVQDVDGHQSAESRSRRRRINEANDNVSAGPSDTRSSQRSRKSHQSSQSKGKR